MLAKRWRAVLNRATGDVPGAPARCFAWMLARGRSADSAAGWAIIFGPWAFPDTASEPSGPGTRPFAAPPAFTGENGPGGGPRRFHAFGEALPAGGKGARRAPPGRWFPFYSGRRAGLRVPLRREAERAARAASEALLPRSPGARGRRGALGWWGVDWKRNGASRGGAARVSIPGAYAWGTFSPGTLAATPGWGTVRGYANIPESRTCPNDVSFPFDAAIGR